MTTFGLVHGAWHGGWCWKYVVDELEARGHTAVAPDLPCDDAAAGLAEYAGVVVDALGEADDVVVVGHSLGSLVIPLVAAARPVRGMVFLCSVPLVPGVTVGPDLASMVTDEMATATRFADDLGRDVFDNVTARRAFYDDCPDDLADWAIVRLRPQGPRPLTEPSPLLEWPDAPAEVILTADDRAVSAAWSVAAARAWLGRDAVMLPGSHSPFLSRPAELTDALVAFSNSIDS